MSEAVVPDEMPESVATSQRLSRAYERMMRVLGMIPRWITDYHVAKKKGIIKFCAVCQREMNRNKHKILFSRGTPGMKQMWLCKGCFNDVFAVMDAVHPERRADS